MKKVPVGAQNYIVKGITFLNTESKPSVEKTIEIKDVTPPSNVKGVKGERKNDEVLLTWNPSTDKKTIGYNVMRSDDRGKTFKK